MFIPEWSEADISALVGDTYAEDQFGDHPAGVEQLNPYIEREYLLRLDQGPTGSYKDYALRPVSYTHLDVYKRQAKILGKENVRQGFFGQEINITTYNLCRINMFLHDIDYDKFDIALGDTLTDPQHWDDEPFEAIVSNPPYSIKWKGDNLSLIHI